MAVQAQYPSNVLLLNRGEGKNQQLGNTDYSLQPQPGGTPRFLDQSHILFNNIIGVGSSSTNPRKRGREVSTSTKVQMSTIQQQQQSSHQLLPQSHHQQQQLIDLTQFHHHQPPPNAVVSTGLRLAFNDQNQQQQRQSHQHSHSPQSSVVLSLLSEDLLSAQINQQRDEIEHFIQAQGEELRRTLAEKRQRHYCALLGAAEESVARRLRDKEAEVDKAVRRNAELEARAAQLSAETQVWQARARAQEATAAALQTQLQQAIISGGDRDECGGGGGEAGAEDAESAYIDPDRVVVANGPGCKVCGKRVASVVLLPCRHLCVCTECDGVVQTCPLCLSFRSSSIEVFLS